MGRGNCCSIVCVGHIHVMMESALYTNHEEKSQFFCKNISLFTINNLCVVIEIYAS